MGVVTGLDWDLNHCSEVTVIFFKITKSMFLPLPAVLQNELVTSWYNSDFLCHSE